MLTRNVKLIVFVPVTHCDIVRKALGEAGAGKFVEGGEQIIVVHTTSACEAFKQRYLTPLIFDNLYSEQKNAFMQHLLTPDNFMQNTLSSETALVDFSKFVSQFTEDTIEIVATARVLLEEKPFLTWLIENTSKKNISVMDKELINKEKVILRKEIEQTSSESRKKIDSILGNKI